MADLDKLYAAVKKQKGKLDIVFANAGTGSFAPHRGAFASSRPKRPRKRFRSILASAYEFSN
jgi:NAD(P)-dependent dehydrogenase (short-subunit alcohol dehydrogenase family)